MVIFVNPSANHGRAEVKWRAIEPEVRRRAKREGRELLQEDLTPAALARIPEHVRRGRRVFVASGGDGSVHLLANALMELPERTRGRVVLGAVGLGSSNDFHKPIDRSRLVRRVSLRIDSTSPQEHNVCEATFTLEGGQIRTRYFVINASMGVLAEGNALFNREDRLIRWLKPRWVGGTILYSALKTICTYENFPASLVVDGERVQTSISNLSLVINPHFTGSFKYDTAVDPWCDHFCVNLFEGLSRMNQFVALYRLSKGRFLGLPHARSWKVQEVEILPEGQVTFEMDGEVCQVGQVKVRLIKGALRTCR